MDRITALKARRAGTIDRMEAILASVPEDGDMTAEQSAEFEALKAKDDKDKRDLEAAQELGARKASLARVVAPLPGVTPAPGAQASVPAEAAEKGLRFARVTRYMAAAKGIPMVAQQMAEADGHSGLFANQNMGSGAAGGFLVSEDVSGEIVELLRPASVVMSFNPVTVPMPNANLTMNRIATGSAASYIGEQRPTPATAIGMGQIRLSARKLAALIPMSNDLLRAASVQVDRLVRDDMLAALSQRMDLAFIRGSGTEFSPRGMRFFHLDSAALTASNVLAANATVNLANVTTDLGRMELALMNADVPMLRPGWIMAPRTAMFLRNLRDGNGNPAFPEVQAGLLRGRPFRTTTQVPINLGGGSNESEVYLADFAQVVVGEHMGIVIDTSTEAAYVDSTSTMQAAFSRDETVVRAIAQHDINARHLSAVAILTGVTWA